LEYADSAFSLEGYKLSVWEKFFNYRGLKNTNAVITTMKHRNEIYYSKYFIKCGGNFNVNKISKI